MIKQSRILQRANVYPNGVEVGKRILDKLEVLPKVLFFSTQRHVSLVLSDLFVRRLVGRRDAPGGCGRGRVLAATARQASQRHRRQHP